MKALRGPAAAGPGFRGFLGGYQNGTVTAGTDGAHDRVRSDRTRDSGMVPSALVFLGNLRGGKEMTANMDPYGTTVLYLSANDTAQWVASNRWACSTLYGHRVRAEFDNQGDLVDLAIDGSDAIGIDGHEFDAITSDCLLGLYGPGHPAIRNSTGELKR